MSPVTHAPAAMKHSNLGPILALALAACQGGAPAASVAAATAPAYTLACDSSDTAEASTLYCVRTDTRSGDILLVDLDQVPVTTGSTRGLDEAPGTYQTVCDSTSTSVRADFRCVRLHTLTGEIVLVTLAELPRWPAAAR